MSTLADATPGPRYRSTREAVRGHFERSAERWDVLTSEAPVTGVRRTIRAGRERMAGTLLGWLPDDLSGRTVLDAGCGTGVLSIELARRGARVVGVDVSPEMLAVARQRIPDELSDRIELRETDLQAPGPDAFDHVVAMDSLIYYDPDETIGALRNLAARCRRTVVFTLAPWTPLLGLMHFVGRRLPRADRAPTLEPARPSTVRRRLGRDEALGAWQLGRERRIHAGFYISQAYELGVRAEEVA